MANSFEVNPKTKQISIYAGDTASMTVKVSGYDWQRTDRALFTVKPKDGEKDDEVICREYEIVNNQFVVEFLSEDTNDLDPDVEYEWDIRFIINPIRDEHGDIIQRDAVTTPGSPFKFDVRKTVGRKV